MNNNTLNFLSFINENTEVVVEFDWEPRDPDVGIMSESVEVWSVKPIDTDVEMIEQISAEDKERLEQEAYDKLESHFEERFE